MTFAHRNAAARFREPRLADGAAIRALIERSPPLDVNSTYAYLLLAEHFAATCVVTEVTGRLAGFVSAYRLPQRQDVLFVWQVAVDREARGRGLGRAMLEVLIERQACDGVRCLETSVSPPNVASRRMFCAFAAAPGRALDESPFFAAGDFGAERHEEEVLLRISFPKKPKQQP